MDTKELIGKQIKTFNWDSGELTFIFTDGTVVHAHAYGDCCSHTWIEGVDNSSALSDGATLMSIEDIDMLTKNYDKTEHECLQFYGCKIVTSKGHCVIDYRNSSNGYYGGSLEWHLGSS